MKEQKQSMKPVKALISALLTVLVLVLLPKFGTAVQAATEITSESTYWAGEMELTNGNVTIDSSVSLYENAELTVGAGCVLTLNKGLSCDGDILTVKGEGTINVNGGSQDEGRNAIDGNIVLNGGTLNATGGNGAGDGEGRFAIHGNIVLNGGTLNATGGEGNGGSVLYSTEITLNGGELCVMSGQVGVSGYYSLFKQNTPLYASKFYKWNDDYGNFDIFGNGSFYDSERYIASSITGNRITFTPCPQYLVSTIAGSGMTADHQRTSTYALQGEPMGKEISFSADEGYFFPTNYSVTPVNGVSVTRVSFSRIIVSGTPTDDTTITLPDATQQTSYSIPEAVFTATGSDKGVLSGLITGARYAVTGATTANFTASGETQELVNVSPGTLFLVRKGNGEDKSNSPAQTLTVGRKATPTLVGVDPDRIGGKGSIPTDTSHEFSTDGSSWIGCTGELAELEANTYYIRVKASGTDLTSEIQTIEIERFQAQAEATPDAAFAAAGEDCGMLTGLIAGASYVVSGAGLSDPDITADSNGTYTITAGMEAGTLSVVKKGNNTTTVDSIAQSISVLKPAAPDTITATACTVASNDNGILSGITTAMQYRKSDSADWTDGTGNDIARLTDGTYYVRYKAAGASLASEGQTAVIDAYVRPIPATVTPVNDPEPKREEAKPIIFSRVNKDGSTTTITIIRNEDGTVTTVTENKYPDGITETKSETRDAKGNGTLSKIKKDADGNVLSKTEGTIKVNKKGTETLKSVTENSDGSKEEKTQKTYKRDADNIKKVTADTKKTDAAGNTEETKMTALVDGLGGATITESSTFKFAKADGITADSKEGKESDSASSTAKDSDSKSGKIVKEERQYSLSVNGRLKLLSLTSDGEKVKIPESIELDGMVRVVKSIGKNALKGNKTVREVVIGKDVTTICTGAFKNCSNLELIELTGSVKKIYKNAFKGIAKNARFVIEASEEDFARIVELLKASGVSDTVTFERI